MSETAPVKYAILLERAMAKPRIVVSFDTEEAANKYARKHFGISSSWTGGVDVWRLGTVEAPEAPKAPEAPETTTEPEKK